MTKPKRKSGSGSSSGEAGEKNNIIIHVVDTPESKKKRLLNEYVDLEIFGLYTSTCLIIKFFIGVPHTTVIAGDDNVTPVLPTTPAANSANTRSSTSDYDDDSGTPLPPSSAEKEEEGAESSQEDDIMNVSTASSLGEELPDTPMPHPQEGVCPYSGAKTGSSSKVGGKGNATRTDFLKAMFSKKHNFTKEDIAKKAPAVTSLIPARNSPKKIETREVSLK